MPLCPHLIFQNTFTSTNINISNNNFDFRFHEFWLSNHISWIGGIYHCAKFGWNRHSTFENMQMLIFINYGLKMPIHCLKMEVEGFNPLNGSSLIATPKRHLLAKKWSQAMYIKCTKNTGKLNIPRAAKCHVQHIVRVCCFIPSHLLQHIITHAWLM